jgi:integrase/recombinase XerD
MDRLLIAIDAGEGNAPKRDGALIRLMAATGVRLSSALGLDVEDLDLERGEARIRRLKVSVRSRGPGFGCAV